MIGKSEKLVFPALTYHSPPLQSMLKNDDLAQKSEIQSTQFLIVFVFWLGQCKRKVPLH